MRLIYLLLFSGILFLGLNLGIKYIEYKSFIKKPQFLTLKVVSQYKKKNHFVLKLKNNKIEFYTISYDDLKDILNREVEVGIITKDISFWGYLTKFYAPTFKMGLLEKSLLQTFIQNQHKDKTISNLFQALFLGDKLYYDTIQKLSTLGISHLLALSGFHLAIISGILYLIFTPIYNFFMPPYRNRNIDLGILIIIILFGYLYFVGFPPSLVRSFLMEVIAFLFGIYLRDIFSFKLLFLVVFISLIIFPSFIVSLGFFLSVVGVFLIFLFFNYFKVNFINGFLFLPIYLYVMMFPISHYFFGNFNFYQLLSPFVTIIFGVFYSLEFILHIFHIGYLFDGVIHSYLELGSNFEEIKINKTIFYGYLVLLIYLSLKDKKNLSFNN